MTGHFLAMSVVPMTIEVLVRVCHCVKRIAEGRDAAESIPFQPSGQAPVPKLHTMLFVAHLVAAAANAGRVGLGPGCNILAVNGPQWVAFFRYAFSELNWAVVGKEDARTETVQRKLDADWEALARELTASMGFVDVATPSPTPD